MVTARNPRNIAIPYPFVDGLTRRQQEELYEDFLAVARGGDGTRWATLVIAAADSSSASRAAADYVCTGASDEVKINAAITAVEARGSSTGAGRIVLLEGTYVLGGAIVINTLTARLLVIQGMGSGGHASTIGATKLLGLSGSNVFTLGGNSAAAGSAVVIEGVHAVASGGGNCIDNRDMPTMVRDCLLTASSTGSGISQTNSTGTGGASEYVGNTIIVTGSGNGILSAVGAGLDAPIRIHDNYISVTGNVDAISCGNDVSSVPTYSVSGNVINGTGTGNGINLRGNSIENCVVSGNIIRSFAIGVQAAGYRHNISGNMIDACTTGISAGADSQYLAMMANHINNATTAFLLNNNAIRPSVVGNTVSNSTSPYSVTAGTTNAFIGYNNFNGTTGTDSGTSTTIIADVPAGGASQFVLKKNSATSGDYGWALDPAIDAITAKGDLLAGLAVDSLGVLSVDRPGQFLMLDSTQTAGIKWGPKLTINNSAPASPRPGDIWIDTSP